MSVQEKVESYGRDHWLKNKMWESVYSPKKPWHLKRLKAVIDNIEGKEVLDVACATGEITEAIREKLHPTRIVGYEGSVAVIAKGRELHSKIEFIHGLVEDLPFEPASFDSIHAGEILEHVADPENFVSKLASITRRQLIITTPTQQVRDPGHVAIFTEAALRDLLGKYFDEIDIIDAERTFVAVCRKVQKKKLLFAIDIGSRAKGDWSQSLYLARSMVAAGYSVDLVFDGPKSDHDFAIPNIDGVTFQKVSYVQETALKWYEASRHHRVVVRGPRLARALIGRVPRDRLFAYIYGSHLSANHGSLEEVWGGVSRVLVQGEGQLYHIKKLGLDTAICVPVPCAIDCDALARNLVVGYVGSLYEPQCVDMIIDAVSIARQKVPCQLVVVGFEVTRGDGRTRFQKRLVERLAETDWIEWIHSFPHDKLRRVYSRLDVMVSLFDPNREMKRDFNDRLIKTKTLEAMASGTLVITNRSWGNVYLLGDDYPYYAENPEQVAAHIVALSSHRSEIVETGKVLMDRARAWDVREIGKQLKSVME
jgi:glycosyltransferase involved in cell wall biosynthesis